MYYVYILRCTDGTHYAGLARYLEKRMREHVYHLPACARYTRARKIAALDALWQTGTRPDAARLEALVKTLPLAKKRQLIARPEALGEFFPGRLDPAAYTAVPNPNLADYLP